MTPIGSPGRVGAIETFDDGPTKPLKGLMGLVNCLAFGKDELALEAAEELKAVCPGTVHHIGVPADSEGGDKD